MADHNNPLRQLEALGQAIWLDSIRRGQILSGELEKLIDEDGLSGETANPTIFEKAIGGSSDYDETIEKLAAQGKTPQQIYETIAIEDVQMACDVFRPVYDQTGGADGFVSIEVSPKLAYDTEETIEEAKRFFREVDRPNVMIKIPGTPQGVPAIEACLYQGVNINITLLFAVQAYEEVAWAYIRALERRLDEGKPIDHIASVASFFVSRIDTLADKLIEEKLKSTHDPALAAKLESLGGKVAIANAKMAYQRFQAIFNDPRFDVLKGKADARVQRPLWASTSTKNPHYSDIMYVESLIGPDTVDTLPLETIGAYRDHGHPRITITEDLDGARRVLQTLEEVGISLDEITSQVLKEGVIKFDESLEKLLQVIDNKRQVVRARSHKDYYASLGAFEVGADAALNTVDADHMAQRIWNHDPTVWKQEPEHQAEIRNRLGWLDIATQMRPHVGELVQFAKEIRDARFKSVVLCGMGGSSLCVEVFNRTFGSAQNYPRLYVLDTTDPAAISDLEKKIDVAQTLFIIASKSGGTVETLDHYRYFYDKVRARKGDNAGENFTAITDPDSGLAKTALENRFRRTFLNPSTIGGRYSALSYFGLIPAALIGVDLNKVLDSAEEMMHACAADKPARDNPGAWLGSIFGALAQAEHDKITMITSPGIDSFGMWAEQLIAESTGKEGRGLVPVADEPLGPPSVYGDDRVFVYLRLATANNETLDRQIDLLERAGHPVVHLNLADRSEIGGEFFRWEYAIAVAGAFVKINPFDQPNVQESKDNTMRVLEQYVKSGSFAVGEPAWKGNGIDVSWGQQTTGAKSLRENLAAFFKLANPGDYLALMAFVEQTPKTDNTFQEMRVAARNALKIATTLGYGPRFLHSTGQLHKGGPNTILALQVIVDEPVDVPIPGEKHTFGVLERAQAIGDWQSLISHGRRALQVHLDDVSRIKELEAAVQGALVPENGAGKRPRPRVRAVAPPRAAKKNARPAKNAAARKTTRTTKRTTAKRASRPSRASRTTKRVVRATR